ncbi:unnamed protein product [Adineta ricciae]|uniref:Uncharacterized protein n=1 Tax=Adineta ricciae TaxID=249248 RepID=A0A815X8J2_ADIRI|nr:unnamed protein product [Adineta ricciae]CAF1554337.1 unnamed protein product [Adineta ricciae]
MLDQNRVLCPEQVCGVQDSFCSVSLEAACNESIYILFPMLPFLHEYAEFGFWTSTINNLRPFDIIPLPDFICYNEERCLFLEKDFTLENKSCSYLEQYDLLDINDLIELVHTCLSIDKSGNSTDCFHPSLFHCPNTSKCISKHRILDGVSDCMNDADEVEIDSCEFNDKYRFHCWSEDKCLAPVLIRNFLTDCRRNEDEIFDTSRKFSFQNLCNGITQLSSIIIEDKEETDETNCEHWPCNNQYTQCNGAWECSSGLDEVNCDATSPCYPNHHLCVSPIDLEIKCLPVNQAGDGKIDCLGSTDERAFCRRYRSKDPQSRYRCWNESRCASVGCFGLINCQYEWKHFDAEICWQDPQIMKILKSPALDEYMGTNRLGQSVYFILSNMSRFGSNIWYKNFSYNNVDTFIDHNDSSSKKNSRNITYYEAWICNRGILIFLGQEKIQRCLCPPSYYGNRCQYQSQRVSLTLQFSKECAPSCRGIYTIIITLIDNNYIIHSYDQFTYMSTSNCDIKHNIYLLFQNRSKNLEKNYTIHIDAYNKIDLLHYVSWILPIKFLFLPVNRISAHLTLPSHRTTHTDTCPLICNNHGRCSTYFNRKENFCLCDSGWSGLNCSIQLNTCDCSSNSKCLGEVNNRSICLCSYLKFGPRCLLSSICQNNPCKNNGQCIADNKQISRDAFICVCTNGYSGSTCEIEDTRIDISFHGVDIPSFLLIHFITVQTNNHPLITTISKKIRFDEYSTTLSISIPFNLIFIQLQNNYYLTFLQNNNSLSLQRISLEMKSFQECPSIHQLFDKQILLFHILRRAKFYYRICRENPHLSCFYDPEAFICLCNNDNFSNCFSFDFNKTSVCKGRTTCENDGQCLQDRATCPQSTMCICSECFYGGKCQFTTKGFSLSLNIILGYHIHSHLSIIQQPLPVKISITITTLMFVIGLLNGFFSIITFYSQRLRQTGCGLYLLVSSIISVFCSIIFELKFWFLILLQMSLFTNRTFIHFDCILMEFILQSLITMINWLNACVAVERVFILLKGPYFNKKKSKKIAKWVIIGIMICSCLSFLHDAIHRELIDDEEESRIWCIVRYSSKIKTFDSFMNIFHFILPFSINIISTVIIIITIARNRSAKQNKLSYIEHLRTQIAEHKHHIISPFILVLLTIPRLIISFFSGCMKSIRNPWLFLFGYFISFIPPLLTFVIFVWPSETYKKEIKTILQRQRNRLSSP